MGLWPFGGGKRQRTVNPDPQAQDTLLRGSRPDEMAQDEKGRPDLPTPPRSSSKSRRNSVVRKLSLSQTPASVRPSRAQTAPASSPGKKSRTGSRNTSHNEKGIYKGDPRSQSNLGSEHPPVPSLPTLYAKRPEYSSDAAKQKSSKRKAEDFQREREIRAMSSAAIPIPKRPTSIYDAASSRRDSRQIGGSSVSRVGRPMSQVSLPPSSLPEIETMSNQNSFRVGVLAALSPRPTIRFDTSSRLGTGKQSARPNMAIQKAIAEEDVSDTKRIQELADDLDAGGLRELMERDRRRREKKKEENRDKIQRKQQRRADRQREEDEARREYIEAFLRDTPLAPGARAPKRRERKEPMPDPFADDAGPSNDPGRGVIPNPFADEPEMDIVQDFDADTGAGDDIPIPVKSPLRRSSPVQSSQAPSIISPPLSPAHGAGGPSSYSQASASEIDRDVVPDKLGRTGLDRKPSEKRGPRVTSWTTFFKRGTRRGYAKPTHGRAATSSEFSNASRESITRRQPSIAASERTFRGSNSTTTAQRTTSRFREDLPEIPISPPDSPEQRSEPTMPALASVVAAKDPVHVEKQDSQPTESSRLESEKASEPPTSDASDPTSVEPAVPQSLASVDSEGSWLSGKPSKRLSGPTSIPETLRRSHSSLQRTTSDSQKREQNAPPQAEEAGAVTSPTEGAEPEKASKSVTLPLQEADESGDSDPTTTPENETWHIGVGRQAQVIRQTGRARSTEGLLNEFDEAETSVQGRSVSDEHSERGAHDVESPNMNEIIDAPLLRAKSVDYKGHIRAMSAGSAKLLEIKRSSTHSDLGRPKSPTVGRKSALNMADENTTATEPEETTSDDTTPPKT